MPAALSDRSNTGKRALRVLLVETGHTGTSGLGVTLDELPDGTLMLEHAGTLSATLDRLAKGGVDLVLLDLNLPDSEGTGTFERTLAFAPDVPIVVLSGVDDEELALSTVRGGAQDYLVKDQVGPDLLLKSIRYAVERHRLISALRGLSLIDDLTGLYNRRGFSELGEQHLKLARRSGRGILLVYADVDDLKTINDTFGHCVGDQALVKVAETLKDTFRQSDLIARIGGDEFAVMALEASEENEGQLIQRLAQGIGEANRREGEPYPLSVSVGMARVSGDGAVTLDDVLARADRAMYEEKRPKKARWPRPSEGSGPDLHDASGVSERGRGEP